MPRRFNLPAGDRHRLQLSCEQEPREQLGVLAVALDPIPGARGVLLGAISSTRTPASAAAR
jgi:hypothetical protein